MRKIMCASWRVLAWLLAFCVISAAAIYGLALAALYDLEQQPAASLPGGVSGDMSVAAREDGRVPTWRGTAPFAAPSGHGAPIVSAEITGDGRRLITSSLDGSVRVTDLNASAWLDAASFTQISAAAYSRLWRPYGAPVAREALWLAAQLLPLHIPETRKGRRGRIFRDCPECPEMVEIGPGMALMGSPLTEAGRSGDEGDRHLVTIPRRFAVGRFEVTFEEWEACVADGGCAANTSPSDSGWGKGSRPVINVSWDDAQAYVSWLSRKTGAAYRLLSETEWEYAARAGKVTAFSWDDEIGTGNANCLGCGSQWDGNSTAPLGSFEPNAFGLYDMHSNVWEWVADCWNESYASKPQGLKAIGAAWTTEGCGLRVLRGGSWGNVPQDLRAANRGGGPPDYQYGVAGFRVSRTLNP